MMECKICQNPVEGQALYWASASRNPPMCLDCHNLAPLEYYNARIKAGLPAVYPVHLEEE